MSRAHAACTCRTQWARLATDDLGDHTPPVVLGEWGGKYIGLDKFWQDKLAEFLADDANNIAGSFYWSFNPDSGDSNSTAPQPLQLIQP